MKVLEDQGFCTCCGNLTNYKFGQENFSIILKNLDNYKKYKNIFAYKCRSCGFVSTDITGTEGVLYGEIKDSYEFKQLDNSTYLDDIKACYEEDYTQVLPVGMYEAYSLVLIEAKDYEKLIRLLATVIDYKLSMKKKYRDYAFEVEGDKNVLNEIISRIDASIETNRQQIDYYFPFLENKNTYATLIYIENMIEMGKVAEALVLLKQLAEKKRLEEDLIDYFQIKIELKTRKSEKDDDDE